MQFPTDHTIKVMGKNQDGFAHEMKLLVQSVFPDIKDTAYKESFSKDRNYLSLTVTVHADNQEQLDRIYEKLSSSKKVLMAL